MRYASRLVAALLLATSSFCGAQTHEPGARQSAQTPAADNLLLPAAASSDDMMLLSCVLESNSGDHEKQNLEIRFSVARQSVELGPDRQTFSAQITDAAITFMAGSSAQESVYFSINRRSGSISVSGSFSVLASGQCRLTASQSGKTRTGT